MFLSLIFLILIVSSVAVKGEDPHEATVNEVRQITLETLANLKYVQINWLDISYPEQHEISRLQHSIQDAGKKLNPKLVLKALTLELVLESPHIFLPLVVELNNCLTTAVSNHQQKLLLKRVLIEQDLKTMVSTSTQVALQLQSLRSCWKDLPSPIKLEIERKKQDLVDMNNNLKLLISSGIASQGNIMANRNVINTKLSIMCTYFSRILYTFNSKQKPAQDQTDQGMTNGKDQIVPDMQAQYTFRREDQGGSSQQQLYNGQAQKRSGGPIVNGPASKRNVG